MRAELFRNWAPAVAWALVILLLSGEGGSSRNTEGVLVRLFSHLGPDALFYINYSLRKGAHVGGYAILGLLNFRALGWCLAGRAVGLAAVVAIVDEGHQATSPLRTAAFADIGFDLCGAALAVTIARMKRRGSRTGPD